ncbi:MAG: PilZ domain-containing protein [Polyangiales bacterium]
MEPERRRLAARLRVNHDFEPFEGIIDAFVTDLSATGAFVRTRAAMPVGSRVDLYFTVLHAEMECVEGVGEVVRTQEDPPGVGVVFVELTPASRAVIERVLAAS